MRAMRATVFGLALLGLAGCSGDGRLRDLSNPPGGPEEFAIVPNKPLQTPPSFAELPPPAPGRANRTDLTPGADAVAALGGDPSRVTAAGIPAADAALVATASRFGVPDDIRALVAAEDAEFRRGKARFTNLRIVRVDRYNQAYRSQSLDAFEAHRRYRAAGARTPSAPPELR
jgi:hypothetical protein